MRLPRRLSRGIGWKRASATGLATFQGLDEGPQVLLRMPASGAGWNPGTKPKSALTTLESAALVGISSARWLQQDCQIAIGVDGNSNA